MTWTLFDQRRFLAVLFLYGVPSVGALAQAGTEPMPVVTPAPTEVPGPAVTRVPGKSGGAGRAPVLNRTVLTVGGDVYTAWDAHSLLCIWNALAEPKVPRMVRWLDLDSFSPRGGNKPGDLAGLPEDSRRLLFLALVWGESKKLNLFVPPEKELEAALATLRKAGPCPSLDGARAMDDYFSALVDARLRSYVDIVLRAKSFERVRGGGERNPALLGQSWFWHGEAEGG